MPVPITTADQIVITASRAPQTETETAASVTLIDRQRIERLGEPMVPALVRLTPSAAVTSIGPAGSLSEVRIRGAEANHTLLFIDGIRANDPAAGDTPRFELLNSDLVSRVEVVRGPQSALWGADAIGGVIAIDGTDAPGLAASSEAGSFGFRRASIAGGLEGGGATLSAAIGFQRAAGIDSFGSPGGDKDGFRNLSGRVRATYALAPQVKIGASGFVLTGRSQFDGYDPISFEHLDTLDNSRNRLAAGRLWVEGGSLTSDWTGHIALSTLSSSNRNLLGSDPVNRTSGKRTNAEVQVERRFATGTINHRLIAAVEVEEERFHSRDIIYGGFSNQDQDRSHHSLTVEWRGQAGRVNADVALRRDVFNRFKDATTLRASGRVDVGRGFAIAASYGEGIAQPTFFDLYGFFPGNFIGNPSLSSETSRGFEASIRYRKGGLSAALTAFRQLLHGEIVDVFDPLTFQSSTANRAGSNHRSGVEGEVAWAPSDRLHLTAYYAFLHATEPDPLSTGQMVELRRPRHSGSIAADGAVGRWSYAASLAYVGTHRDRRDNYPYDVLRLGSYALLDARIAYSVRHNIEVFARGSNLLGQKYQDSAGYRTEGTGLYAGVRLTAGRRSSP
ncbi:MAG: TonB-dependent receptor [Pseudomonadota bacterium]